MTISDDSKGFWKKHANYTKVVALLLIVVSLVGALFLGVGKAYADDDDDKHKKELSFYKMASAATAYYDDTHDPADGKLKDFGKDRDVSVGNAGGFVGFLDEDYDSFIGSFTSYLSGSSQSHSYTAFDGNNTSGGNGGDARVDGVAAYVRYGHALESLGLDSTGNPSFDFAAILRYFVGILLGLVYAVSAVCGLLFKAVIKILQVLNPFSWFGQITGPLSSWLPHGAGGALGGLTSYVSRLYNTLSDFAWSVTMPAFFIFTVITILLWRKSSSSPDRSPSKAIKKYVMRACCLVLMVPICGGLYTAALNQMDTAVSDGSMAANNQLARTLVDFENWASNTQLAMPSLSDGANNGGHEAYNITVTTEKNASGDVTNASTDVQTLSLAINRLSGNGLVGDAHNPDGSKKNAAFAGFDLINRYMKSSYYNSSDFETDFKGTLEANGKNSAREYLFKDLKDNSESKKLKGENKFVAPPKDHPPFLLTNGTLLNVKIDNNGKNDNTYTYTFTAKQGDGVARDYAQFNNPGRARNAGSKFGLSTLAMFNYLNTDFQDSSVVTYSSHKLTSAIQKQAHKSVNVVGSGSIMRILILIECIVSMLVVCVISICYAVAIIVNNLKRGISVVVMMPMAMLGVMKSIARFIGLTVTMILEMAGTLLAYSVFNEILGAMNTIVTKPIQDVLNKGWDNSASVILPAMFGVSGSEFSGQSIYASSLAGGAVSMALSIVALIAVIILNLWVMIMALRMRSNIVKFVDEWSTGLVSRFLGADASVGGGGSRLGAMAKKGAGAVASGAGMMAGANAYNRVAGAMGSTPSSVLGQAQKDNPNETPSGPSDGGDGGSGAGSGANGGIPTPDNPGLAAGGGVENSDGQVLGLDGNPESTGGENGAETEKLGNEMMGADTLDAQAEGKGGAEAGAEGDADGQAQDNSLATDSEKGSSENPDVNVEGKDGDKPGEPGQAATAESKDGTNGKDQDGVDKDENGNPVGPLVGKVASEASKSEDGAGSGLGDSGSDGQEKKKSVGHVASEAAKGAVKGGKAGGIHGAVAGAAAGGAKGAGDVAKKQAQKKVATAASSKLGGGSANGGAGSGKGSSIKGAKSATSSANKGTRPAKDSASGPVPARTLGQGGQSGKGSGSRVTPSSTPSGSQSAPRSTVPAANGVKTSGGSGSGPAVDSMRRRLATSAAGNPVAQRAAKAIRETPPDMAKQVMMQTGSQLSSSAAESAMQRKPSELDAIAKDHPDFAPQVREQLEQEERSRRIEKSRGH